MRADAVPTASTYGPSQPMGAAGGIGIGVGAEPLVDALGDHLDPRRVDAPSRSTSSPRENSDTVITSRARRAIAGSSRRW